MLSARYVPSGREKEFISYRDRAKARLYRICVANISCTRSVYIAKRGGRMSEKTIKELAVELTIEVTNICDDIKNRKVYTNQIMRSCSSIGANVHEAKYAQSRADFIHKMEIALKECHETEYWLEILFGVNAINENTFVALNNKCGKIRRKLIASITTTKKNTAI